MIVGYKGVVWDCQDKECGTNPCDFCKDMMREIDEGTVYEDLKKESRREYFPFLEDV